MSVPATFYSSNPNYTVHVAITWANQLSDFDLYLVNSNGTVVGSSTAGPVGTSEFIDAGQLPAGNYEDCPHALGNLYGAAIQGVPGGTDVLKSMDGGKAFSYLGEPDGAQALSTAATGVGIGGGDEDLDVANNGTVYVTSLWLCAVTGSTSFDGGSVWKNNPVASDIPGDDRQWIAAQGNNILYLAYKQVGADLNGTVSIVVVKSFDGGLTYPQVSQVTTPELGVQPGDQGNIVVDSGNGNVYTMFIGQDHPNELYLARSTGWVHRSSEQGMQGR